jgi:hypothetical protein
MLFDARRDQALRAEARATTLQGSVAIAIGLTWNRSAFLLDPAKVQDRAWRIALGDGFAALLVCLATTGYVTSRATIKVLPYAQPTVDQVMRRGCVSREESDRDRALSCCGHRPQRVFQRLQDQAGRDRGAVV